MCCITLIAAGGSQYDMAAQFSGFTLKSSNQQIIEDAVEDGFVVVSRSFRLQDKETGQLYGYNNMPEFGRAYTLGVRTEAGILCAAGPVESPWDLDPRYERYAETLSPLVYKTYVTAIGMSAEEETDEMAHPLITDAGRGIVLLTDSTATAEKALDGFSTGIPEAGEYDGWGVWLTSPKSIDESGKGIAPSQKIFKRRIKFTKKGRTYPIQGPSTEEEVWGGIYLMPVRTSIGHIDFKLVGIMAKADDGTWSLCIPDTEGTAGDCDPDETAEDSLTPLE